MVASAFAAAGALVVLPDDLESGVATDTAIRGAILAADLFVGVLTADSFTVGLEAGWALADRKPTAFIVDRSTPVPTSLLGHLHVRSDLADQQLLQAFARRLLESNDMLQPSERAKVDVAGSLTPDEAHGLRAQLRDIVSSRDGRRLERLVQQYFREVGVEFISASSVPDRGADFVLDTPALGSTLGSPILVELKLGRMVRPKIDIARRQLEHSLDTLGGRTGLLLTTEPLSVKAVERFRSGSQYVLLTCTVERLIDETVRAPLFAVLSRLRNESIYEGAC
jgi:hypothetical protein